MSLTEVELIAGLLYWFATECTGGTCVFSHEAFTHLYVVDPVHAKLYDRIQIIYTFKGIV